MYGTLVLYADNMKASPLLIAIPFRLGNNRGTTWSMNHTTLSLDSPAYWDFTWQEMAHYYMPAILEYILKESGQDQLTYVGHSEGAMQALAGFSINQTLARKVSFFAALAPVTNVGHQRSPIFQSLVNIRLDNILQWIGVQRFFHQSWLQVCQVMHALSPHP